MNESRREEMMQAAVVTGPRQVSMREVPVPEPKRGEVRVRLEGCGVCASNLAIWEGASWAQYPTEPGGLGHEGWGIVDAVGPDVDSSMTGERVAMLSYHAYAQFDLARADQVIRIPKELADQPFPGEALGCAMNIFKRSQVLPKQRVAIVGVGFLGAILTRLAQKEGAEVIAITRRSYALEIAHQMGARAMIPMDDHQKVIGKVMDLTNQSGCEVVIEATGKQWPLDLASEIVAERGRLVIAGYHQDGPRQVNMQLWNWKGLDVVNAHERDPAIYLDGMENAAHAIAKGVFDPSCLYRSFSLPELDKALDATLKRPDGFMKAWVDCR